MGENDYVINLDGQQKMFHANMLRKYMARKIIDKGMAIRCACRHLGIATGGIAKNDYLEEPDTCEEVKKGVIILKVHSEPHRRGKISMKTIKGR